MKRVIVVSVVVVLDQAVLTSEPLSMSSMEEEWSHCLTQLPSSFATLLSFLRRKRTTLALSAVPANIVATTERITDKDIAEVVVEDQDQHQQQQPQQLEEVVVDVDMDIVQEVYDNEEGGNEDVPLLHQHEDVFSVDVLLSIPSRVTTGDFASNMERNSALVDDMRSCYANDSLVRQRLRAMKMEAISAEVKQMFTKEKQKHRLLGKKIQKEKDMDAFMQSVVGLAVQGNALQQQQLQLQQQQQQLAQQQQRECSEAIARRKEVEAVLDDLLNSFL
jgi:hypothetical protein